MTRSKEKDEIEEKEAREKDNKDSNQDIKDRERLHRPLHKISSLGVLYNSRDLLPVTALKNILLMEIVLKDLNFDILVFKEFYLRIVYKLDSHKDVKVLYQRRDPRDQATTEHKGCKHCRQRSC